MPSRSTILFPLLLLSVLALLTLWIDHTVKAPEKKPDGSDRHDPDYILRNFTTTRTDNLGNLRYILKASQMKHYPDDDSTDLLKPHFGQYAIDKPYTQVEGDRGFVSSDGEIVEFMNNVKVTRDAFGDRGEMNVYTEYLKVMPDLERSTTDQPVMITQAPKTVIYATGMIYDKKQQTMELLSRVKVHYEHPEDRPAPAARVTKISKSRVNSNQKRAAR